MNIIATILQILLGLVFLAAGVTKLAGQQQHIDHFRKWGYPQWFRLFTGACEVVGAIGLLLGIGFGWLAAVAGVWIVGIMIGALITHVRAQDRPKEMIPAAVLLVLAVVVLILRWSSLSSHL